jgi:hypothetical protein
MAKGAVQSFEIRQKYTQQISHGHTDYMLDIISFLQK